MSQHGIQVFPEECCGAMLGSIEGDIKTVMELIPIENQSTENKQRRFALTPDDYQHCEFLAKEKQLVLLGFYHTHPNEPAIPSETDKKYAWPFFFIYHFICS